MDKGSIIGLPLGVGMILTGMILEGGHMKSIMGGPAFMIVVGGALGATLLDVPFTATLLALKRLKLAFLGSHHDYDALVEQICNLASIARKDGLLALEKQKDSIEDPLLKEGIKFAVDGLEPNLVSQMLESRIEHRATENELAAKFYTQFGAYCPTVGILGAVLGLIHVMENLSNPDAIGPGIAVAFIATVYGVGFSNLLFMPLGSKLKALAHHEGLYYEMIRVGVKDIQSGTSPTIISSHLLAIVDQDAKEEV